MQWTPSEALSIALEADVTRERQTGLDYQLIEIPRGSATAAFSPNVELYNRVVQVPSGRPPLSSQFIPTEPWETYSTWDGYNNSDILGTALIVDWDLGVADLKSTTAYRDLDVSTRTDADGTPLDIVSSGGIENLQRQFSLELQLSGDALDEKFNWVGGL